MYSSCPLSKVKRWFLRQVICKPHGILGVQICVDLGLELYLETIAASGFDAAPHTPSAHFSLMMFLGAVYWKMCWVPEVFNT